MKITHRLLGAVASSLVVLLHAHHADAFSEDTHLIDAVRVGPNRPVRTNISGTGNVPQYWVATLRQESSRVVVRVREERTGRTQRFSFVLEDTFHSVLATGMMPSESKAPLFAVGLDYGMTVRNWAFLAFDYSKNRFVPVIMRNGSNAPLHLENPRTERTRAGQDVVVERAGGSGIGSVTCWRPNEDGTALSEWVGANMNYTIDSGNRYAVVRGRASGAHRKIQIRHFSENWDTVSCEKLASVFGRRHRPAAS